MDEIIKGIKYYAQLAYNKSLPTDNLNTMMDDDNETIDYGDNPTEDNDFSKQKYTNIYIALNKAIIRQYKGESYIVQIIVKNNYDKKTIDEIRKELTQYLLSRTHYPHLKLEVMTQEKNNKVENIYSPVDKFNFFKQSSPAIEHLREAFNCDIKY